MNGDSTGLKNNEKTKNKDVVFIVLQRIMRSMHSSERNEEMVSIPKTDGQRKVKKDKLDQNETHDRREKTLKQKKSRSTSKK